MPDDFYIRQLNDSEEDNGYQAIIDTVAWLQSKNIKQWENPLPRHIYAERQRNKENHGFFLNGNLIAIMSILTEVPEYWRDIVNDGNTMWLSTLAVVNVYRGKNYGKLSVIHALQYVKSKGIKILCLDCTPGGYLESFYSDLGFQSVCERTVSSRHGLNLNFKVVLMKYQFYSTVTMEKDNE
jgi:GNAT superfamily N-acetyltransferase